MLTLWESINKLWTIRIWQIWQQDFTGFKAFPTHLAALSDKPTIYKQKKLDSKYFQNRFSEYSCRSDDVLRWDSDPFRRSFADTNVWWNEIGSLTKFKTNQKLSMMFQQVQWKLWGIFTHHVFRRNIFHNSFLFWCLSAKYIFSCIHIISYHIICYTYYVSQP